MDKLSVGDYYDICSRTDSSRTYRAKAENTIDSYQCRLSMQCCPGWDVLYWRSATAGQCIQRTILHSYFRYLNGKLNTYYSGLKREEQLYCYLLGNGATRQEAQAPFIRQAIIKAFSPLIANIAVMGLVALPGTMIGQILGGSSPNVAIKYQMMIMVITFTASMLSLMITISLASRKSFDAYGKLLQVMVEKKEKK